MGHKRVDETMLYVHIAEAHHLKMLAARGSHVAAEEVSVLENPLVSAS